MTIHLKAATASQEIPLGRFVDSTDGNTEETGLTIANTDIKLWKTGATTLASKNSGGATHIANGIYYCVLDDTDTDTVGPMVVHVHVAGALAVKQDCVVLPANVYDSLVAGSDTLNAAVTEWNGVALGTTNPLPNAAPDAVGGLVISDAGGLDIDAVASNVAAVLADTGTDGVVVAAGSKTGYSLAADQSAVTIGTVTTNTDMRGTDNAFLAASAPTNFGDLAITETTGLVSVGTMAASALADFFDVDSTSSYAAAVAGSVAKEIADNAGGASLTVDDIADAVWDEALSGHATAGTAGKAVTDIEADTSELQVDDTPGALAAIDAKIDTLDTVADGIKAKTDSLTFTVAGNVDSNVQYVNDVEITGDGAEGTEWGPA